MHEFFQSLSTVEIILIATGFTWLMTMLGSSVVFFLRTLNRTFLNGSLGFAAGVMIAASVWSLLIPSFEILEERTSMVWLHAGLGFLLGAACMVVLDKILPHLHVAGLKGPEGISTSWHRSTLLVFAITLHNIPEGMAIGVAIATATSQSADVMPALMLALGIGIQNIPEGMAVSLPLRNEGLSNKWAFFWGQFSGFVEILSGILGAIAVLTIHTILPYALAFSAGAMMYIVIEELIPQSQADGKSDIPTIGAIIGFTLMMILDNL